LFKSLSTLFFIIIISSFLAACGKEAFEADPRLISDSTTDAAINGPSTDFNVYINQDELQEDSSKALPVKFRIVFVRAINIATFDVSDITQNGSAKGVIWKITGDKNNKIFELSATSVNTQGTIIPSIASGTVSDPYLNKNNSSIAFDNSVMYATQLLLVIEQKIGQSDPTGDFPIEFDLMFSTAIDTTTFNTSDIVNNGTAKGISWNLINSGDGTNFTLQALSASTVGTIIPSVAANTVQTLTPVEKNLASTSADNTVRYAENIDITVDQKSGQLDPINIFPIEFTIIFSEAINDSTFDLSDITHSGTATGLISNLINTGDDTTYTLQISSALTAGTIIPTINSTKVTTANSVINNASTSTDNSVKLYFNVYTSINQKTAQLDPSATLPVEFDVVFSEVIDPTTFMPEDIIDSGTAKGVTWNIIDSGDQINYTLQAITASTEGTIIPSIADNMVQTPTLVNNYASVSSDDSVTYDTSFDLTIEQNGSQLDPTNITPVVFDIVFDEAINPSTFTNTDITQEGTATVDVWTIIDSGDQMNFTLSATVISSNGTIQPSLAAATIQTLGSKNNNTSTSTDNKVDYDVTIPTVDIDVPSQITFSNHSAYTFTGTCSENTLDVIVKIGTVLVSPNPVCSLSTWSATVDISGDPDNTALPITAHHTDAALNNALQASTTVLKDTFDAAVLTYAITSMHDFGNLPTDGHTEVTILINKTGNEDATLVREEVASALAVPFSFLGGSFPGTGATCSAKISGNCTIKLAFDPTTSDTFNDNVFINYYDGVTTQQIKRALTGMSSSTPPTKIITSAPAGVIVNECIPVSIDAVTEILDNSNVSSNETISLVVNNGAGSFHSDKDCALTTDTATIILGTNTTTTYFKGTNAGDSLTLIFNASSLESTNENISVANAPTKISVNAPGQAIKDSACTAIEVDLVDKAGNKVGRSVPVQVNLSQDGSAVMYSDSSCTAVTKSLNYAAYEESKFLYLIDTTVETVNFTFIDNAAVLTSAAVSIDFVSTLTWWDSNYRKRLRMTLNNLDQSVTFTEMPVMVKINSRKIDYIDFKADGTDIRFTLDDHTTTLKYDIEEWNSSGTSVIWVKVPSVAASSQVSIFMYYNYNSATDSQDKASVWSYYSGVWNMDKTGVKYIDGTLTGNPDGNYAKATGETGFTVKDITGPVGGPAISLGNDARIDTQKKLNIMTGYKTTVSYWIRSTATNGNDTAWQAPAIYGISDDWVDEIYFGFMDASGFLGTNTGNGDEMKSNFIINDGNWRHVTMTRDDVSGMCEFYVNGVLNNSGTTPAGTKDTAGKESFSWGAMRSYFYGDVFYYLKSDLDNIRVKADVLNSDRIKADYKFGSHNAISYSSVETL
jgi:hypothetical protein